MASVFTTLAAGVAGLTSFYLYLWFTESSNEQRHGCQKPCRRPTCDPILGLGYQINFLRSSTAGTVLPISQNLHGRYGLTYRESSLFGTTLKTASDANIHTIFGLEAEEWGVQPFRNAGMRLFCGDGFLTMDGRVWEHSRTLLKPSFHKSNISDLAAFEESLESFLEQLPKNGSTADLDPLASKLVGRSTLLISISSRPLTAAGSWILPQNSYWVSCLAF